VQVSRVDLDGRRIDFRLVTDALSPTRSGAERPGSDERKRERGQTDGRGASSQRAEPTRPARGGRDSRMQKAKPEGGKRSSRRRK
jgi:ribonuclease R